MLDGVGASDSVPGRGTRVGFKSRRYKTITSLIFVIKFEGDDEFWGQRERGEREREDKKHIILSKLKTELKTMCTFIINFLYSPDSIRDEVIQSRGE